MRRIQRLLPLALVFFLDACTSTPRAGRPVPEPAACQDSLYLELKAEHPDSLSDRAWERLQQLSAECRAEPGPEAASPTVPDGGHRFGMWLWMSATMVVGGLMWLMMGGV